MLSFSLSASMCCLLDEVYRAMWMWSSCIGRLEQCQTEEATGQTIRALQRVFIYWWQRNVTHLTSLKVRSISITLQSLSFSETLLIFKLKVNYLQMWWNAGFLVKILLTAWLEKDWQVCVGGRDRKTENKSCLWTLLMLLEDQHGECSSSHTEMFN